MEVGYSRPTTPNLFFSLFLVDHDLMASNVQIYKRKATYVRGIYRFASVVRTQSTVCVYLTYTLALADL